MNDVVWPQSFSRGFSYECVADSAGLRSPPPAIRDDLRGPHGLTSKLREPEVTEGAPDFHLYAKVVLRAFFNFLFFYFFIFFFIFMCGHSAVGREEGPTNPEIAKVVWLPGPTVADGFPSLF